LHLKSQSWYNRHQGKKSLSPGVIVIEEGSPGVTVTEEGTLSLVAAEEIQDPAC
jgi:hypothetical protein